MTGRASPTTRIVPFDDSRHRAPVAALWREAFGYQEPRNAPSVAIVKKVAVADGLFFVAEDDGDGGGIVGTVMAGYDGHRGWLYSVAVAASHRRHGIGRALVRHAEAALCARGCMKVNLQLLASNEANVDFYRALGYQVEPRISMGKAFDQNVPPVDG